MPTQLLQCPFCPTTSTRGTGLASHIRGSHPGEYQNWSKNRKSGQTTSVPKAAAAASSAMPGGFKAIVAQLEKRKSAIDRALQALREMEG